ncbi:MAG: hypothetical protein VB032_01200 [Burkholderiaceae bacterium]|nr:hypothetical protein [Burkholderiaceae bacterium]
MNAKKGKILLASVVIGVITTAGPFFSSGGFSADHIAEWLMNALFVIAIVGFLGMKFFGGDDRSGH